MPPMQERTQPSAVIVTSDENELVQRARSQDRAAFRSIMQKYNRRMYRMARTILRNENEAEDVVQEAFVSAFTHLDSFRGDASLSTWLARITMNEAMGRLRAHRRIRNYRPRQLSLKFLWRQNLVIQKEQWLNVKYCVSLRKPPIACPNSIELSSSRV
jgi:DNA-directed RNA polymerase specialized sigma24 family protein